MVKFLENTVGPIFYGLGVSEADFSMYLKQLIGYVYFLLALVVVLIIILIAAQKAKKGFRHVIRWQAVIAFIMVMAIVVNIICYGPMYNNVSNFLNTKRVELSQKTTDNSKETVKRIGEEGFVLAKNNGSLPLSSSKKNINVFGWASTNPFYGGTGSGSSDTSNNIGILDSLKNAGFSTNKVLTGMYTEYRDGRPAVEGMGMSAQNWSLPEPTKDYYTDDVMKQAKDFSDTAVVVIGRSGGEGADLPTDMKALIDGTYNIAEQVSAKPENYNYFNSSYENNGSEPDFDEGESYLELSNPEEDMIDTVCANFENVIVIINSSNTMELGWTEEHEQIGSVILAPGAGVTGFEALGEILNGSVNPSGKTADTYVKDLFATPYINNIGNNAYTNVDDLKNEIVKTDESAEGNIGFVNYVEGIYVGYKFYETAAEEGLLNYDDAVQYPFGYGLSYTTFEENIENFKDHGDNVTFDVKVTNTGDVAGKDVVEIYYTPPYNNGGIEKSAVNLIQFEKTGLLEAGDSESVSFTINKEDMASYDSEGIKVQGGGYILEAGQYEISLREDSHTVVDTESFTVDTDIDYSEGRSSDETKATNQFQDYSRGEFTQLSRSDGFANYAEATGALKEEQYVMDDKTRKAVEEQSWAYYDSKKYDNSDDKMPVTEKDNDLKLYDLAGADYNDDKWDQLLDQMSVEEMISLVNVGGWQTVKVKSIGKVATSDCDGPAGMNNFVTQVYGTSFPAEVLMAQTWNKELLAEVGEAIGTEFDEAGFYGWYGPAVNTHRSAFAGRNFEYFSEDGVLAGYLAAKEKNGAANHGVYSYIKHFALNDQETNRDAFLLTYASEQAIRENYLKSFELAIKGYEGKSQAVMSSYNFIGTIPSSANSHLLNSVLRDEWGFEGMVITDYDGSYGFMISDNSVRNGNDLMLGFAGADSDEISNTSATMVNALRKSSKNILYTVANSGYYAEEDPSKGFDSMTKTFIMIDVIIAAVLVLIEVLVILNYRRKHRKAVIMEEVKTESNE